MELQVGVKILLKNKDGKYLVLLRSAEKYPNVGAKWEIPGGRLDLGEDPILGLMREVREETGLYVDVLFPMSVRHFVRDDGQIITMLVFLCKPKGGEIKLSEEHECFDWIEIKDYKNKLNPFFHKEVHLYEKLNLKDVI